MTCGLLSQPNLLKRCLRLEFDYPVGRLIMLLDITRPLVVFLNLLNFREFTMFTNVIRWAVITGLVSLTSACATEYTYTPPDTVEGRSCTTQCQTTQRSCRNTQHQRASDAQELCKYNAAQEQSQCEHHSQTEYNACLKFARTNIDRASCIQKTCLKDYCNNPVDYSFCDREFRGCYQNCGGRIGILK